MSSSDTYILQHEISADELRRLVDEAFMIAVGIPDAPEMTKDHLIALIHLTQMAAKQGGASCLQTSSSK